MKHRLWGCSQGKLRTRQNFPDEEFARESEGMAATHGMYSWAQRPHCRGHRADSRAHTVPFFHTRVTSSLTAHSASVSILQGELGRRVLGEPSVTVVAAASWRARGQALSRGAGEAPLPPPQLRGGHPSPCTSCVLPLQCETSLDDEPGLCWCVYPWSREKIPGSVEVRGDPNCSQYFSR